MTESDQRNPKKNEEHIKAYDLAKKQREISIAEFFEKNRHLLGFDNPRKALLTAIKEAVDNSLDACEEAGILPEIIVEVIEMNEHKPLENNDAGNNNSNGFGSNTAKKDQTGRFRVRVEDNGPGIVKEQIPRIFAKLLYGSKFHTLKQSRGQQGIGISAAVLYSQLTTGRPARITSKIDINKPAHYYELCIDTKKNEPKIIEDEIVEWKKEHGTKIEFDLEASYTKGMQSVDEYLKQTAIINPHVTIIYTNPKAEQIIFARATEKLPVQPKEIKPHPYGVELGRLMKILAETESRTLQSFLTTEFSRVGPGTAKEICEKAALLPSSKPRDLDLVQAEKLIHAIQNTKIISPPTDCISPIGEELIEKGLRKEVAAEFYVSCTRPPNVYRGNPFVIEAGIAYGGELSKDEQVKVLRYANRVPLLYQPGACSITDSVEHTSWRPYGLNQSGNSIPSGPAVIMVHFASVWAPFTSEAKEAIAHYPEIIKEIKLALQECGRKLSLYVNKKKRAHMQLERASLFENYIPEIADALSRLAGADKAKIMQELLKMTKKEEIQAQINDLEPDENGHESEDDGIYKLKQKNEEDDSE